MTIYDWWRYAMTQHVVMTICDWWHNTMWWQSAIDDITRCDDNLRLMTLRDDTTRCDDNLRLMTLRWKSSLFFPSLNFSSLSNRRHPSPMVIIALRCHPLRGHRLEIVITQCHPLRGDPTSLVITTVSCHRLCRYAFHAWNLVTRAKVWPKMTEITFFSLITWVSIEIFH